MLFVRKSEHAENFPGLGCFERTQSMIVSAETEETHSMSQEQHNKDRMRRADSWHGRSLRAESDDDRFIFLWIAFNAAYGSELNGSENGGLSAKERQQFRKFFWEVLAKDTQSTISRMLQATPLMDRIRALLVNPYVYRPFWWRIADNVRDSSGVDWATDLKKEIEDKNDNAWSALLSGDAYGALTEIFERLYTLRNQVFHGGATYRGGKGRDQIRDGAEIMAAVVPAILDIMRADIRQTPDSQAWGDVAFPTVLVDIEYHIRLDTDEP